MAFLLLVLGYQRIMFEDPVSSPKPSLWFTALAAIVFAGAASTSEAQGYYHGHGHVVVGGYYYASPFWFGAHTPGGPMARIPTAATPSISALPYASR